MTITQTPLNIVSPLHHITHIFGGRIGEHLLISTSPSVHFHENCTEKEIHHRAKLFCKIINKKDGGFATVKTIRWGSEIKDIRRRDPATDWYEAEIRVSLPIPRVYFLNP